MIPGIQVSKTKVKNGMTYVAWHFNCLWDTEHGFEVITHKARVLEIAPQADLFSIYEDNFARMVLLNALYSCSVVLYFGNVNLL